MAISFAPKTITAVGEQVVTPDDVYNHGFLPEEVRDIEKRYFDIFKRDLALEPTTLEEFKVTIVPWLRIHRTTTFNLFPDKPEKVKRVPKEKVARVSKPRVSKAKNLVQAVIEVEETEEDRMGMLHFRQVTGKVLTKEEIEQLEAFRSLQDGR